MGIPKFASWLSKKYPEMVIKDTPSGGGPPSDNVHGLYIDMNGIIHPCCHSEDDPSVAKRSDEEKIHNVCLTVEHLLTIVKPTTILYLASDGVAPRAKMNQQRARRYMAAYSSYADDSITNDDVLYGDAGAATAFAPKETSFTKEEEEEAEKELAAVKATMDVGIYGDDEATTTEGGGGGGNQEELLSCMMPSPNTDKKQMSKFPVVNRRATASGDDDEDDDDLKTEGDREAKKPKKSKKTRFDSNCISPGTLFMSLMAERLQQYVKERVASGDAKWTCLEAIIISGTDTPGEGEHKIIDFMRTQSSHHGWLKKGTTPSHVIVGLDADLILLCLSLHMPRIFIMRDHNRRSTIPEEVEMMKKRKEEEENADGATNSAGGEKEDDTTTTTETEASPSTGRGGHGRGRGGRGRGGGGRRHHHGGPSSPSAPKYEYYSIDAVGAGIVSDLYYTSTMIGIDSQKSKGEKKKTNHDDSHHHHRHTGTHDDDHAIKKQTHPPPHPCATSRNHRIINDFIALATVMGNDFVPRLPSAFCGESAMDNIMECYIRYVMPFGFLTHDDYVAPMTMVDDEEGGGLVAFDLDLRQLERFFEGYARVEAVLFRQYLLRSGVLTDAKAATPLPPLSMPEGEGEGEGDAFFFSKGKNNSSHQFRPEVNETDAKAWYNTYLKTTTINNSNKDKTETQSSLELACASYVEGIRFVWRYYAATSEQCSWLWYYPFHHAPPAMLIASFLRHHRLTNATRPLPPPKLEVDAPTPMVQLLSILPPTSRQLLPTAFHDLMCSPPQELEDTFCTRWSVDYAAASGKEHLASVLLPFVNMPAVMAAVQGLVDNLTPEERIRNTNSKYHLVLCPTASSSVKDHQSEGKKEKEETTQSSNQQGGEEERDEEEVHTTATAPTTTTTTTTSSAWFDRINNHVIHGVEELPLPESSDVSVASDEEEGTTGFTVKMLRFKDSAPLPNRKPKTYSWNATVRNLNLNTDNNEQQDMKSSSSSSASSGLNSRSLKRKNARTGGGPSAAYHLCGVKHHSKLFPSSFRGLTLSDFTLSLGAFFILFRLGVIWMLFPSTTTTTTDFDSLLGTVIHECILAACLTISTAYLFLVIGVGLHNPTFGSGVLRNATRDANVDWLCQTCLALNFSKNEYCYQCECPFEVKACNAVFSGRLPQTPPLMDPDHSAYIQRVGIRVPPPPPTNVCVTMDQSSSRFVRHIPLRNNKPPPSSS